jgi:hypothetical protein
MIKTLINIANDLDAKGLAEEAGMLDGIINKAAGLWDEALTDDSTELLREEDLSGVLEAEQAWHYSDDDDLSDPDSYVNRLDINMDRIEDTNIMPSQAVGDEDLLTTKHSGDLSDDPFLSEGLMGMAEMLLSAADKDGDNSLSASEIAEAIYDYVFSRTKRNNPEADDDGLDQIFKEELSLIVESNDPIGSFLDRTSEYKESEEVLMSSEELERAMNKMSPDSLWEG